MHHKPRLPSTRGLPVSEISAPRQVTDHLAGRVTATLEPVKSPCGFTRRLMHLSGSNSGSRRRSCGNSHRLTHAAAGPDPSLDSRLSEPTTNPLLQIMLTLRRCQLLLQTDSFSVHPKLTFRLRAPRVLRVLQLAERQA